MTRYTYMFLSCILLLTSVSKGAFSAFGKEPDDAAIGRIVKALQASGNHQASLLSSSVSPGHLLEAFSQALPGLELLADLAAGWPVLAQPLAVFAFHHYSPSLP